MYNHNKIEKKWQKYWLNNKTFAFNDDLKKPKFYVLDMFPYPSGKGLHVGHPKGYTATDVISRYKRLNGFSVLHPIGWDAFGLPAEQYALETNNHPKEFTQENINHFRKQLQGLGFDYDYNKEVDTTDPKYYKWTQWIFTKLYEHNLAELKDVDVNWCEGLSTVLANEEVILDKNGNHVSERGGFLVVKKPMKQWVLKITKYADKLLEGLEELDWPESLKHLQRNWIGKMVGVELDFNLENSDEKIKVFTTRIDTIYGVSFLALSPKHKLAQKLVESNLDVRNYLKECDKNLQKDFKKNQIKTGVLTTLVAIHPLTKEKLPVYISDYVITGVGTDSVMGVPGHDENDFEFAKLFKIKIKQVIDGDFSLGPILEDNKHINSYDLNGLLKEEAIERILEILKPLKITKKVTNYKLRDWLFSRQRYWGEPFPVYFDENNKIYLEKNLPLKLPETKDFKPSKDGKGPLANIYEWLYFEKDGKKYHRDTNTMPQWAGSCWYYLGYLLKQLDGSYIDLDSQAAFEIFKRWLPVDIYIGGQEHAVLHLLYARFWHRFLYDIKIVPTKEPFFRIINQGMILGENGEKMSKSKGNVINPDEIIASHGADALRLYEMFMGPLTASLSWSNEYLNGMRKWLDRVYRVFNEHQTNLAFKELTKEIDVNKDLVVIYHQFVKKTTDAIENQQFNMAISYMMVFINDVYKYKEFYVPYMQSFLVILSVFAPHLSEELFSKYNNTSVALQEWPQYNLALMQNQKIIIPVMINGKLKETLMVEFDTNEDELKSVALNSEKVKKIIGNSEIFKIITVKNKIINLIIKKV